MKTWKPFDVNWTNLIKLWKTLHTIHTLCEEEIAELLPYKEEYKTYHLTDDNCYLICCLKENAQNAWAELFEAGLS